MKHRFRLLHPMVLFMLLNCVDSQAAAFTNLGFESASLPAIPRGQEGGFVPIAQALPGWNAFLGTNLVTQVLHNSVTLGSPAIWIWGPDWPYASGGAGGRIEGNFTVILEAGTAPSGPALAISQTGLVPVESQWLFFKAITSGLVSDVFEVSLGDELMPVVELARYSDYTLYGGNVSAFAGSEADLRFKVYRGLGNALLLDSIVFAVPEPGGMGLFAVGVAAAVCWRWRLSRRRVA